MEKEMTELEKMIKFFYDNEEFYMEKARANTKYDSLGRIILPYDEEEDDIEKWSLKLRLNRHFFVTV